MWLHNSRKMTWTKSVIWYSAKKRTSSSRIWKRKPLRRSFIWFAFMRRRFGSRSLPFRIRYPYIVNFWMRLILTQRITLRRSACPPGQPISIWMAWIPSARHRRKVLGLKLRKRTTRLSCKWLKRYNSSICPMEGMWTSIMDMDRISSIYFHKWTRRRSKMWSLPSLSSHRSSMPILAKYMIPERSLYRSQNTIWCMFTLKTKTNCRYSLWNSPIILTTLWLSSCLKSKYGTSRTPPRATLYTNTRMLTKSINCWWRNNSRPIIKGRFLSGKWTMAFSKKANR